METKAAGSLTHGRLGKQILAFSLPLMLSNVLQVLFNMSDIAVVGRFSGPIALGAVGIHSDARYPVYGFSHWPWQRYQCPCCALSRRRQP